MTRSSTLKPRKNLSIWSAAADAWGAVKSGESVRSLVTIAFLFAHLVQSNPPPSYCNDALLAEV